MNQHEASGSDDDMSDNEDADALLAKAVLESEMEDGAWRFDRGSRQEAEQDIMAEVRGVERLSTMPKLPREK